MEYVIENIWTFRTENFNVYVDAIEEDDIDLSWDDTGEVQRSIDRGDTVVFCARVQVHHKNLGLIGSDYLGNCVYKTFSDFRDHFGVRPYQRKLSAEYGKPVMVGSPFSGMVREAIAEARNYLARARSVPMRETV